MQVEGQEGPQLTGNGFYLQLTEDTIFDANLVLGELMTSARFVCEGQMIACQFICQAIDKRALSNKTV